MGKRKAKGKAAGSNKKTKKSAEQVQRDKEIRNLKAKITREAKAKAAEEVDALEESLLNESVVSVLVSQKKKQGKQNDDDDSAVIVEELYRETELSNKRNGARALWNAVERSDLERVKRITKYHRQLMVRDTQVAATEEQLNLVLEAEKEGRGESELNLRGLFWKTTLTHPQDQSDSKITAFVLALSKGNLDIAKLLVQTFGKQEEQGGDSFGGLLSDAGMEFIVEVGNKETLEYLVSKDEQCFNQLANAALRCGHRELLQRLLRFKLKLSFALADEEGGMDIELGASQSMEEDEDEDEDEDESEDVKMKDEKGSKKEKEEEGEEEGEENDGNVALQIAKKIKQGVTRLHLAALEATSVEELKKLPITIDEYTTNAPALENYVTPLMLSCLNPNIEILKYLLKEGKGDLTIHTDDSWFPVNFAAVAPDGTEEIDVSSIDPKTAKFVDVVKPSKALDFFFNEIELDEEEERSLEHLWREPKRKVFRQAMKARRLHTLAFVTFYFDPKESARFRQHRSESTDLTLAFSMGDLRFFKLLLCSHSFRQEMTGEDANVSARHLLTDAIKRKHMDGVQTLLDGDIEFPEDPPSEAELVEKYVNEQWAIPENAALLEAQKQADLEERKKQGAGEEEEQEQKVKEEKHVDAVEAEEEEEEEDQEEKFIKAIPTIAHLKSAVETDAFELAKLLIEKNGEAFELGEILDCGVIHQVIKKNQLDFLKLLLDNKANPLCIDAKGNFALLVALRSGSLECAKRLLEEKEVTIDAAVQSATIKKQIEDELERKRKEKEEREKAGNAEDKEEEIEDPFENKYFVLTGVFSVSKRLIEQTIQANGGFVQASVNKKTSVCVYSGVDGVNEWGCRMGRGDKKYKEAKKRKLPFVDEQFILRHLSSTNEALVLQHEMGALATVTVEEPASFLHDICTKIENRDEHLVKVVNFLLDEHKVDPLILDKDGRNVVQMFIDSLDPSQVENQKALSLILANVEKTFPENDLINTYDLFGLNPLLSAASKQKWKFVEVLLERKPRIDCYVKEPTQDPEEEEEEEEGNKQTEKDVEMEDANDAKNEKVKVEVEKEEEEETKDQQENEEKQEQEEKKQAEKEAEARRAAEEEAEKLRKKIESMRKNAFTGWSFLHFLAVHGQVDLFKTAIEQDTTNCDLNSVIMKTDDKTPLLLASLNSFSICQFLVTHPAVNLDVTDANGRTLVHALFESIQVGFRKEPEEEEEEEEEENKLQKLSIPVLSSPVTLKKGGFGFSGSNSSSSSSRSRRHNNMMYGGYNSSYYNSYSSNSNNNHGGDIGQVAIQSLISLQRWTGQANKKIDWKCKDKSGNSSLHLCCQVVQSSSCANLILKQAPELLNSKNDMGNTPLSVAILNDKPHLATFLIDHFVADLEPGCFQKVKVEKKKKKKNDSSSPSSSPSGSGSPSPSPSSRFISSLSPSPSRINRNADENETKENEIEYEIRETSLYEIAVKKNLVGVFFAILQHPQCQLQKALQSCISAGSLDWTENLLNSLDIKDGAFAGQLIYLLIKCTVQPNEETSARILALVKRLASSVKSVVLFKDEKDEHNNLFHWFVMNKYHPSILSQLLNALGDGEDAAGMLNEQNAEGNSPLHLVIQQRNLPILTTFLDFAKVNVDLKNSEGITPLHLAFNATSVGMTISTEIMGLLINKGADLLIQNNMGQTAASIIGMLPDNQREQLVNTFPDSVKMNELVKKEIMAAKDNRDREAVASAKKREAAQAAYAEKLEKLQKRWQSLNKNRQKAAEEEDERQMKLAKMDRLVVPIDSHQPESHKYQVYIDKSGGLVFDAYLQSSNSSNSFYGRNAFMHLQLCELNDEAEKERVRQAARSLKDQGRRGIMYSSALRLPKYRVTERWGRAGDDWGAKKRQRGFQNLSKASEYFFSVFTEKTKSEFGSEYHNVQSAKYSWVKRKYEEKEEMVDDVMQSEIDLAMPREVSLFLRLTTNLTKVRKELRSAGLDTDSGPLSLSISKSMIHRGFEILARLEQVITAQDRLSILRGKFLKDQKNEVNKVKRQLEKLSDQLYETIPRSFGSYGQNNLTHMRAIKTHAAVQKEVSLLTTLEDVEETLTLVLGSVSLDDPIPVRLKTMHDVLGVNLRPVQRDSDRFKMLEDFCHASSSSSEIVAALRCTRYEDALRFSPFEADRGKVNIHNQPRNQLLFHSTKVSNGIGICFSGLKLAPPEAPTTGFRFGKGIYFADSFAKSAMYAGTRSGGRFGYGYGSRFGRRNINNNGNNLASSSAFGDIDNLKIMFVCEVALGERPYMLKPQDRDVMEPPEGYDSLIAPGSVVPNPQGTFLTKKGVGVPMGKQVNISSLNETERHLSVTGGHSEYIVFDPSRIKIKYVILFR